MTGPEFRIVASKMAFLMWQALARPAQIRMVWKYIGVNSGFSEYFPDFDPLTSFITAGISIFVMG